MKGLVEAGLSEIFHHVLGRHQEEDVAPTSVACVSCPQGQIHEELSGPDLGGFLDHDQGMIVAGDVG